MTKTRKNNYKTDKTDKTDKTNKKSTRKKHLYTKDEFNSGDGMLTSVWGPGVWHFLHTMSFNYLVEPTIEEKNNYRNFILNLKHVLPCKFCRLNLATNFKQLPLTMEKMKDRATFSRYIYDLHELVNKMLHKKSNLAFCDVQERYEHFRARCTDKPVLFKYKKLNKSNKNKEKEKEKGCTEPLYGKKSKCIIKIVPQDEKGSTFQMDKQCVKTKK